MTRPHISPLQAIKKEIAQNSKILLAVSGGIDSMVLLHVCLALKTELKLTLEVAHLDHGLREESFNDAEFVKSICKDRSVDFHSHKVSPPNDSQNIEAWGRNERYSFFNKILIQQNLDFILTAHNANDVAETLLMRLVSNKELNSIDRIDFQRLLKRPFLYVTRDEIEKYSKDHQIQFKEDSSNQDTRFLRNKIRHNLLPVLRENFDPRIVEVLSIRAEALNEDIVAIEEILLDSILIADTYEFATKAWRNCVHERLVKLPIGLQWRFAALLFKNKLGFNLGRQHAKELVLFLKGDIQGLELPGNLSLKTHLGAIIVGKNSSK